MCENLREIRLFTIIYRADTCSFLPGYDHGPVGRVMAALNLVLEAQNESRLHRFLGEHYIDSESYKKVSSIGGAYSRHIVHIQKQALSPVWAMSTAEKRGA